MIFMIYEVIGRNPFYKGQFCRNRVILYGSRQHTLTVASVIDPRHSINQVTVLLVQCFARHCTVSKNFNKGNRKIKSFAAFNYSGSSWSQYLVYLPLYLSETPFARKFQKGKFWEGFIETIIAYIHFCKRHLADTERRGTIRSGEVTAEPRERLLGFMTWCGWTESGWLFLGYVKLRLWGLGLRVGWVLVELVWGFFRFRLDKVKDEVGLIRLILVVLGTVRFG